MLCDRVIQNPDALPTGHVLMATYPPREHVAAHPEIQYPHQLPNVPDRELIRLFGLTETVPEEIVKHGEVSPIEAWRILWSCQELSQFSLDDLFNIQDHLMPRVRCYGYGAVIESFEVQDAIQRAVKIRKHALHDDAGQTLHSVGSGEGSSQDHHMVDQQMTGQLI